jgi:hypothetical protein
MRPLQLSVLTVLLAASPTAASAQTPPGTRAGQNIPPLTVSQIFTGYCTATGADPKRPYCTGESIPDAIKWLVLCSDCSSNGENAQTYCRQFTEHHAGDRPLILQYDHEHGRWSALTFEKDGATTRESDEAWRVSGDINGVPTITRSGTPVPVIVSHTNPLLYGYALEPTKLDDLEGLADVSKGGGPALAEAKQRYVALDNATAPSCAMPDKDDETTVVAVRDELRMLADTIDVDAAHLGTAQQAADTLSAVLQPDDKAGKEAMAHAAQLLSKREEAGEDCHAPGSGARARAAVHAARRLTGGWTWQRMPELDGQKPGDVVSSKADIRTRDHFARDWYVALVFALDSLPVFRK